MTTEADGIPTALVPGAHRTIRALGADEGPFQGVLVAAGESVAVMSDADELTGWAGWGYAGCDHVAGPLDLVRRADGQDVLLPWCTETVISFLGRREAMEAPLTAGEASTLIVSVLRGVGEVVEDADHGRWWLTEGGRPVFVVGAGDDVRDAAAAVVDRVRRAGGDRAMGRLLSTVHDGLVEGRARPRMSANQLERWEAELFEIAAPRALDTAMHAPERVRGIEMLRDSGRPAPTTRRMARGAPRQGAIVERARSGIAHAADRVHRAVRALSAQLRRSRRDRSPVSGSGAPSPRRKLAIAAAAAVAVIAGGLLWPGGATGEAAPSPSASRSSISERSASPDGASASPEPEGPPPSSPPTDRPHASDDPTAATTALLEDIAACASREDLVCDAAVASGSAGVVEALSAGALSASEAPVAELVDAYGDIAVVRLSPADGAADGSAGETMLVLARLDEKWLVRDVYGVADQPG